MGVAGTLQKCSLPWWFTTFLVYEYARYVVSHKTKFDAHIFSLKLEYHAI